MIDGIWFMSLLASFSSENVTFLFKRYPRKTAKKELLLFVWVDAQELLETVKKRQSLTHPWERVVQKLSQVPVWAGRKQEVTAGLGGSMEVAEDGEWPQRVGI